MPAQRKYTREILQDAVENSDSVAGVLRYLGLPQAGGTHAHIGRTIRRFGLDTSHFHRSQGGRTRPNRKSPADIFVTLPAGSRRSKPAQLRRALVEIGRPYRCASCGAGDRWNGQPLTLHVDHVNGDYCDNAEQNLRFMCPNCHSQTASFAGRSRGKYAEVRLLN
jgi:predicted RNA-binding Zn-ribbon protein involved in translation (DUF1610 family)